jgi:hypothetical protein
MSIVVVSLAAPALVRRLFPMQSLRLCSVVARFNEKQPANGKKHVVDFNNPHM